MTIISGWHCDQMLFAMFGWSPSHWSYPDLEIYLTKQKCLPQRISSLICTMSPAAESSLQHAPKIYYVVVSVPIHSFFHERDVHNMVLNRIFRHCLSRLLSHRFLQFSSKTGDWNNELCPKQLKRQVLSCWSFCCPVLTVWTSSFMLNS